MEGKEVSCGPIISCLLSMDREPSHRCDGMVRKSWGWIFHSLHSGFRMLYNAIPASERLTIYEYLCLS